MPLYPHLQTYRGVPKRVRNKRKIPRIRCSLVEVCWALIPEKHNYNESFSGRRKYTENALGLYVLQHSKRDIEHWRKVSFGSAWAVCAGLSETTLYD